MDLDKYPIKPQRSSGAQVVTLFLRKPRKFNNPYTEKVSSKKVKFCKGQGHNSFADAHQANAIYPSKTLTTGTKAIVNSLNAKETTPHVDEDIAKAIKKKKVFQIIGSPPQYICEVVRAEFTNRGWVEKSLDESSFTSNSKKGQDYNQKEISWQLRNIQPSFIWLKGSCSPRSTASSPQNQSITSQSNLNFASKLELSRIQQRLHWHHDIDPPIVGAEIPRSYAMNNPAEMNAFSEDYRLTLCTGFLLQLLQLDLSKIFAIQGTLPTDIVRFAVRTIKRALDMKQHRDIDKFSDAQIVLHSELFHIYGKNFKRILKEGVTVKVKNTVEAVAVITEMYKIVVEAITCFPHLACDGYSCLWILKAADSKNPKILTTFHSRESSVLDYCSSHAKETFIVQKFIEHPLLINKKKFDLRQYFLVTIKDKVIDIWMYKSCYLKFGRRNFNPLNLRQLDFRNRILNKQKANIWLLPEFKNYLKGRNEPESDKWQDQIYSEMVQCIKAVVLGALEDSDLSQDNIQILGADFIITEYYHPLLITIKSELDEKPLLNSTKEVCEKLIQDTVKVLIDYPVNRKCSTGDFENVFRLNMCTKCVTITEDLGVPCVPCKIFKATTKNDGLSFKNTRKPLYLSSLSLQESSTFSNSLRRQEPLRSSSRYMNNKSRQNVSIGDTCTRRRNQGFPYAECSEKPLTIRSSKSLSKRNLTKKHKVLASSTRSIF